MIYNSTQTSNLNLLTNPFFIKKTLEVSVIVNPSLMNIQYFKIKHLIKSKCYSKRMFDVFMLLLLII